MTSSARPSRDSR